MTDLRELLAQNLRKFRSENGFTQEKLAEKAKISTHYVGMIELKRNFPTPEILEQIASALNIDTPELFSIPPDSAGNLKKLQRSVLKDVKTALDREVGIAVEKAIKQTVFRHISALENKTNSRK